MMGRIPSDYIDPTYKQLKKKAFGKRIIEILCFICLNGGILSISEIEAGVSLSRTYVRRLLTRAIELRYVESFRLEEEKLPPGRPPTLKLKKASCLEGKHKTPGRRPILYKLTMLGLWLIRLDHKVREQWQDTKNTYRNLGDTEELFNEWADVYVAIYNHPILRNYEKPFYPMDRDFFRVLLNRFVYADDMDTDKVVSYYNELVELIAKHVKPRNRLFWYKSLESSLKWHKKMIRRQKILAEKIKAIS